MSNENPDIIIKSAMLISSAINYVISIPKKIWNVLPKSRITKLEERTKELELHIDAEPFDDAIRRIVDSELEKMDISDYESDIEYIIDNHIDTSEFVNEESVKDLIDDRTSDYIDRSDAEEVVEEKFSEYSDGFENLINDKVDSAIEKISNNITISDERVKQIVSKALHDILIMATTKQYMDSTKCDTEQQQ
jgi:hypothetical protein